MFIAMNRFKIVPGKEEEFEKVWRERDTHLKDVEGFEKFNLVKGDKTSEFSLYASHSIWKSKDDFINWTKSEAFRLAHKNAGQHKDLYLGAPKFEGFEVVL
tara:strand:- start:1260 stop:1562 length:303 start_codon:yes stop_codon:yes gene_type:complete